jgi:hypothetical protein
VWFLGKKFINKLFEISSVNLKTIKDNNYSQVYDFNFDFHYLIKKDSILFLLEAGMMEEIITHSATICFQDAIQHRSSPIQNYDQEYCYENICNMVHYLKQGFKTITEIDFSDKQFNRKIAKQFYNSIISLKKWWDHNSYQNGFISIHTPRFFSIWALRYLLNNLLLLTSGKHTKDEKEYCQLLRKIFEGWFHDMSTEELEQMLKIAAKGTARSIGFCHEIESNKWMNYGENIKLISGNYFYQPVFSWAWHSDVTTIQIWLILTSNPTELVDTIFKAYSIDGYLFNLYEELMNNQQDAFTEPHINDTTNLKLFLYLLSNLMSDDRKACLYWIKHNQLVNYDFYKQVSPQMDQAFHQVVKNEAIHNLVKHSGSFISALFKGIHSYLEDCGNYEKELQLHSKRELDKNGREVFKLHPEYVSHFNSFYYDDIKDRNIAVEKFREHYNLEKNDEKVLKNDCLNVENCPLGQYLWVIRSKFLESRIPEFLISLLKISETYKIQDQEVKELLVHLLGMFISHASHIQTSYPQDQLVEKVQRLIEFEEALFSNLLDKACYHKFTLIFNQFVYKKDGIQTNLKIDKLEEEKSEFTMEEKGIDANAIQGKNEMTKKHNQTNLDFKDCFYGEKSYWAQKCQKCSEPLLPGNFLDNPYGFISILASTKLHFESAKQTFYRQKELDVSFPENSDKLKDLEFDEIEFTTNVIGHKTEPKFVIKSCKHMLHIKCLPDYFNKRRYKIEETKTLAPSNKKELFCPSWKQFLQILIPPLRELETIFTMDLQLLFESGKTLKMDLDILTMCMTEIIQNTFYTNLIHKDFKENLEKHQTNILFSSVKFVWESIHLIDIKGLRWGLTEWEKLRTVLMISKILLTWREIDHRTIFGRYEVYLKRYTLFQLNISEWIIFTLTQDFLFQTISKNSYETSNSLDYIKIGYAILLLQIAARVIYKQNGYFVEDYETTLTLPKLVNMVKEQNAHSNLSRLDIETPKKFIEGSLSYLRKAAATLNLFLSKQNRKSKNKNP